MKIYGFILLICWSVITPLEALDQAAKAYLDEFFLQYERPITIFEFCKKSPLYYSKKIAKDKRFDATAVIVFLGDIDAGHMSRVKGTTNPDLIILRPSRVTPHLIQTLSKCEQPDVVLLHNVSSFVRRTHGDYIQHFLLLGDYLGVDILPEDMALFDEKYRTSDLLMACIPHVNNHGGVFAFFKTNKEGIVAPRWGTAENTPSMPINYVIKSNFKEKAMFKKELRTWSNWEKGINLANYVMLEGKHPEDYIIRQAVKRLAKLIKHKYNNEHNDLVMSNILIQGDELKPMDFNDPRHDIDLDICIWALLKAFSGEREDFETPEYFLDYYRDRLN